MKANFKLDWNSIKYEKKNKFQNENEGEEHVKYNNYSKIKE